MKKTALLFLISLSFISVSNAQVWRVNKFISEIESGINQVNSIARKKDMTNALAELDKVNNLIRFSEFDTWYQDARKENGNYKFQISTELEPQFNVLYWGDMLQKVDKNKKLLNEALAGIEYDKSLDNQDQIWVYLKTIYNTGKSIKDIAESFAKKEYGGAFFNTKEGIDQFIDDYKKIEDANLQKLNTAAKEQNIKLMISKAKKMERNFFDLELKVRKGYGTVDNFNTKINELYATAKNLDKMPRFNIDFNDSKFKFDGSDFIQRIKAEGFRLHQGSIEWSYFEEIYSQVVNKALQDKKKILAEIQKSDDESMRNAKIDEVNDAYESFVKEASMNYKSLEKKFAKGGKSEKLNLNEKLPGFERAKFPSRQNSGSGSSGDQIRLSSVKAEADIQKFINHIHAEVAKVNELANRKQMSDAIDRLNDLNRTIEKEIGFYFEKNYRLARENNPDFTVKIQAQLSGQFQSANWESSLNKTKTQLTELNNQYYSIPKSNARVYWERAYSICKTIYDITQFPDGVKDEYKEKGAQEAWNKLDELKDGIKEDIKKIENAFDLEEEIPVDKTNVEALIKKSKEAINALESILSYMKVNEEEAVRFYSLINQLEKIKKEVESGPIKKLDTDDNRYDFDNSDFYKRLSKLEKEFKNGEINWKEFDLNWKKLNREAEDQKDQVLRNIKSSDDLTSEKKRLTDMETKEWDDYYDYAVQQHDLCFEISKKYPDGNVPNEADKKLFEGSTLSSHIEATEESDMIESNENADDSMPKGYVGKILNTGKGGGTYYSLDVNLLSPKDVIELKVTSGKLKFIQVIWRNNKGVWVTKYQGNRTKFEAGEFIANFGSDITHLIFVVNSNHNHFKNGELACEIDILHFPSDDNSSSNLSLSSTDEGISPKTNTSSSTDANSKEFVGKVVNMGNSLGQWRSLKIKELADKDILELKIVSGRMDYITVLWEKDQWSKVVKYSGNRTRFDAGELLKNVTSDIVWLTFVVNSKDTRFKAGEVKCEMGLYHYPSSDRRVSKPTQSIKLAEESQQMNAPANTEASSNFNAILKKANESFNKPYWKDNQSSRTVTSSPTNPKQDALNILRQAEPLINQQFHLKLKYQMVVDLVKTHSSFAKRVNVDKAKEDFIKTAAGILNKYGNSVSSINKGYDGMSAAEVRSASYAKIGEAWRDLTQAALWGNHEYNKMDCDKQTKRYYELALRENPKDFNLKKIVEQINAPK
ncbi:MAG: hypothetical protein V1783_07895 [Bacteroidota bacterium]